MCRKKEGSTRIVLHSSTEITGCLVAASIYWGLLVSISKLEREKKRMNECVGYTNCVAEKYERTVRLHMSGFIRNGKEQVNHN